MGSINLGKVRETFGGDWDSSKDYDMLTIVKNSNGARFISKQNVPAGTELTNADYWEQLSVDWTDQEILDKIKNVDGANSGLDADLIRGLSLNDNMNITFYVDAENGDDNNDGSETSPFKSIKRACDATTSKSVIILLGNSDFIIYSDIDIGNKYITLYGGALPTDTKPIIKNTSYTDSYGNTTYGFLMQNSYLIMQKVTIQTANYADNDSGDSYYQGFVKRRYGGYLGFVFVNSSTIKIGDTPFLRKSSRSFVNLTIDYRNSHYDEDYTIEQNGENVNGLLLNSENNSIFNLNISSCSFGTDKDGNNIVLEDLISGIAKDADSGNPYNMISNVNFSD